MRSGSGVADRPARVRFTLVLKSIVAVLLVLAAGVPILETWESLLLAAALLAVVFGMPRPGAWRLAAAAVLVVAVLGAKTLLPRIRHAGVATAPSVRISQIRPARARCRRCWPP